MFLILALLMTFVTGCASTTPAAASKDTGTSAAATTATEAPSTETVKVGFLGYISGSDTYLGIPAQLAMEDYIKEINAKGGLLGRKVELITYDIARGIEEVAPATTKLVEQDKVIAVLGPTSSSAAMAANPVVTKAKVPLIALSATNAKVTVDENGVLQPYMFRVCFIDPYQGEALGGFASSDLGLKKVAILTDVTSPYSQGLTDIFTAKFTAGGGSVVATEGFNENDIEFRAQLTKIGQTDAEAIFIPAGNYRYGVLIGQQAKELGIDLPFLFADSVYAPELLDESKGTLNGCYITTGILDDDPAYETYRQEFAKAHPNVKANIYSYFGMDAIMALEAAVNKAQSLDPEKIRDALETLDTKVFTSDLVVDPKTHNPVDKPITIMTIEDNKFVVYKTFKP
jgi:branched-chain amino acid transport system substrate-binding protein